MDTEAAPEFIYDQAQFYHPSNGNYSGYVYTGTEPYTEWDNRPKLLGLDGQELRFSGLQTESFPCVYYNTPNYEYGQSPFNPYNPYIPGAVIGTDGQFIGTQQYISAAVTNAPYLHTVSPPAYIPLINQSGPDMLMATSPNPMLFNGAAANYAPALSSMSVTTTPLKVSLENLTLEPSHPSSHQTQMAGRLLEAAGVTAAPRMKFPSYGNVISGSAPQMIQGAQHSSHGGILPVLSPLKATLPANAAINGFTNVGANAHGWAPMDRMKPRLRYSWVSNMGPRINKPRTQLISPIALKAYTTKACPVNVDGDIVLHANQYNKDDFPVDYPEAKFFVIKSYSEDDLHKSIKYNVWSSTTSGNKKLDIAYEEAQRISAGKSRKCPVFLFFSVNASGHFCGVAEMVGPVDFLKDMDFWLQDKWTGSFPVKWHIVKDVPNSSFRHIILVNNEYRPVTSSRDTQEVPYLPGINMLTIFKNCSIKTSLLDDLLYYEERQQIMHEEKSLLLGTRSYGTPVSPLSPVTIANGKEKIVDSNEKQMISHTGDKDSKTEDKQQRDANQLSKSNTEISTNGRQNYSETKRNQGRNQSMPKVVTESLGKTNTKNLQDKVRSDAASREIGETDDVFTVGSMQINISDTNRSITGTLTIGSLPADTEGFAS